MRDGRGLTPNARAQPLAQCWQRWRVFIAVCVRVRVCARARSRLCESSRPSGGLPGRECTDRRWFASHVGRETVSARNRLGAEPSGRETVWARNRLGAEPSGRGTVWARNRLSAEPSGRGTVWARNRLGAKPSGRGSVWARNRLSAEPFWSGSVWARNRLGAKPSGRGTIWARNRLGVEPARNGGSRLGRIARSPARAHRRGPSHGCCFQMRAAGWGGAFVALQMRHGSALSHAPRRDPAQREERYRLRVGQSAASW